MCESNMDGSSPLDWGPFLEPTPAWSSCDACVWLGRVKSRKSKSVPCVSAPSRSFSSVSRKVSVCEFGPKASTLILAQFYLTTRSRSSLLEKLSIKMFSLCRQVATLLSAIRFENSENDETFTNVLQRRTCEPLNNFCSIAVQTMIMARIAPYLARVCLAVAQHVIFTWFVRVRRRSSFLWLRTGTSSAI